MSKQDPKSRQRAGLLWSLLGKKARRRIADELSLSELKELNDSFREYRKMDRQGRRRVERETRQLADISYSAVPTLLFFVGIVLFAAALALHVRYIEMNSFVRYQIFTPLFLGAVGPLACYFIPAYRLRTLFRFELDVRAATVCFVCFMGLLWTLFFIGDEMGQAAFPVRGISLYILLLGAATAPFLEEVAFREVLPNMVSSNVPEFGHLVSALIFAAAHLPTSIDMFALYTIAALFLAWSRVATGGLLYPLIIHALANVTILSVTSF